MSIRRVAVSALVTAFTVGFAANIMAAPPQLIPKELLFGNPDRAQARISPDGKRMSYLAPQNNVLNVWVKTIGQNDDKAVTSDTLRGIRIHMWAEDNEHMLFMQDVGGDENWHIYSVNLATGVTKDLTPFPNVQAQPVATDIKFPNEILAQMNQRDPRLMDLHRINIATGESKMVGENPGNIVGWLPDNEFKARAAQAATPDGGFELLVRDTETDPFRTLVTWGPEEDGQPYGFTPDGQSLYIGDSRESNVTRLKTINVKTGEESVIAQDARVDLGGIIAHPTKYHIQAVSFNYDRDRWQILDKDIEADLAALEQLGNGEFSLVARDRADKTWLIAFDSDVAPTKYYTYNRDTKKSDFLFSVRAELEKYQFSEMKFVEITTSDGLTLPCYLTLPAGVDPKNLPMVLNVHGGPWARDEWGFNPEVQWMANRGWAVLQVNFRGAIDTYARHEDAQHSRDLRTSLTRCCQIFGSDRKSVV
jgi:dipeptidyl aminopeptidase/acylaminoacyl peptidase